MAIEPYETACLLLAAGRSERFGQADKLQTSYRGKPLLYHALAMFDGFSFARKILVCRQPMPELPETGFEIVTTDRVSAPMSYSIQTGLRALGQAGVKAVLVALGDMPNIPKSHVERLLQHFESFDANYRVASRHADVLSPPALFGIGLLPELMQLEGDRGARQLLQGGHAVPVSAEAMLDIDTPSDLRNS